jgi:hypothetical protein
LPAGAESTARARPAQCAEAASAGLVRAPQPDGIIIIANTTGITTRPVTGD